MSNKDEMPSWALEEDNTTASAPVPAPAPVKKEEECPAWALEDTDPVAQRLSCSDPVQPPVLESRSEPEVPMPDWAMEPSEPVKEPEKVPSPPAEKKKPRPRPQPRDPGERKTWDFFFSFPECSITRCCCFDFGLRYLSAFPGQHVQESDKDANMDERWYLLDIFCCECVCQADENWDLCQILCCEFGLCCCCIPDKWCKKPSASYQIAGCCEAACGFRAMCLKMAFTGDDWEKEDTLCKMNCCCFHLGCDSAFYMNCQLCCLKYDPGREDEVDNYRDISRSKAAGDAPSSKKMDRTNDPAWRAPTQPRSSSKKLEMREHQRDKERQRNEIRRKYGLPTK